MNKTMKRKLREAASKVPVLDGPPDGKLLPIEPITPESKELHDLCRYRCTYLSDDVLTISHWIADARYDHAVTRLLTMSRNLELLAGYLSKLVESVPKETPEMEGKP